MNKTIFDISPETLKLLEDSALPPITARTQRTPDGRVLTDPRSLYADAGSIALSSTGQIYAEQASQGITELTNGGVLKVSGLTTNANDFGLVNITNLCINTL